MSFSGCADISNVYGIFSNILQEINPLPYKQLDRVEDASAIFGKMMKSLNHSNSPKKCL